jgi:primosomal protein N'
MRGACMCGVGGLFSSPPMSSKTTSKCLHCKEEYHADPRNCGRQRYCLKADCRQASKAASQRQWLSRPENRDYFRGAENCERVRLWRLAHPGYRRNKRPTPQSVLQEPLIPQAVANEQVVNPAAASVLQEILFSQPAMFVGLISVLTGSGLQEDIAESARSFLNRGEDILRMVPGSPPFPSHENQAHSVPRTLTARPPPI